MKIAFVNTNLICCGGIKTNFEYCKELLKKGIEAQMLANEGNKQLEDYYGIQHQPIHQLLEYTHEDVIIANRWEQCEDIERYRGRKIQFVQGKDLAGDIGDDWKAKCSKWRNNPGWELIGVSNYCLEDWSRGTVIPNGLRESFLSPVDTPKDIDILIEGNNEPNKGIERAMAIAKDHTQNIAWLGRETTNIHNVKLFTNPIQEQIPSIYARSKVLLKLSKSEGFCLPILEAMSQNCAVVTHNMGGNDFCQYGYNCEKEDKLKEVLEDDYYRSLLCRAGIETAKQYTWEKATEKLLSLLNGK